jgi:hypothetical protein
MGEGSHHDTIDDFFGDWNFRKVKGLGKWIATSISMRVVNYIVFGR